MRSRIVLAVVLLGAMSTLGTSQEGVSAEGDVFDEMARQEAARIARLGQDVRSLAGVKDVYVLIEYATDDAKGVGLPDDPLQGDIEVRLRLAGIKVIPAEESLLSEDGACLRVKIRTVGKDKLLVYNVSVQFEQDVYLARSPNRYYVGAATWQRGVFGAGSVSEVAEVVREAVKGAIDEFLNDYLTANASD